MRSHGKLVHGGKALTDLQVGKDCVAIASDMRLGQQALTISTNFPKIFPMGEKILLGLTGLATDVLTLYAKHIFVTHNSCTDSKRFDIKPISIS